MIRWLKRLISEIVYRWKTRGGFPWSEGYDMTLRDDEARRRQGKA